MASYGDVDESPYSSYEFGEYSSSYHLGNPNPIDYASSAYYTCSYDYYSEPQFLQYEPPPHYQGYFPKFTISYSNVEFNEPEFEEYDPTPYDGGYDQRMTYGKPLPPSDLTCYPRSLPGPQSHTPLEDFSYNSIPSPYGKDHDIPIHPPQKIKPAEAKAEPESKVISDDEIVEPTNVIDSPSYDHVPQVSYGSGLEAIDLCESIFGYWPCLAKKAQQQRDSCQVCDQDTRMDPWGETAADYFFGSPMPYDYDNYHHHQSDQVSWLQ